MKQVIGVVGLIGSGKDTVADYLVNEYNFKRESFARSLKDAVAAVFGWDREMLEGRTNASRQWREAKDEWWSERLGKEITPRWVLQYWGTEVCRVGFHNDIWVSSLENRVRQSDSDIIITDCRFPNEIKAINDVGGKVIRIKRGEDPLWYAHAVIVNDDYARGPEYKESKGILEQEKVHASEYSWAGADFDLVLENNGTIDDLYKKVQVFIKSQELAHP
jgi:hypothetical protein